MIRYSIPPENESPILPMWFPTVIFKPDPNNFGLMSHHKTTISLTGKYHNLKVQEKNFFLWTEHQFHWHAIYIRISKLRALISNNFGRRKNDPAKDRKALETYVELRGYKQHDNQWTCQNGVTTKSTLDEIAKELNMSKRNLQRALRIERNLTDSMKELLDTGNKIKYRSQRTKQPMCAAQNIHRLFFICQFP